MDLDLTGGLIDAPISEQVKSAVDDLLGCICSCQLQALYKMGSMRMVDRALAEAYSAEFLRLIRVATEDLSKSLHHHYKQVQEAASDLEAMLYRLISHPLLEFHSAGSLVTMQLSATHTP